MIKSGIAMSIRGPCPPIRPESVRQILAVVKDVRKSLRGPRAALGAGPKGAVDRRGAGRENCRKRTL